MSKTLEGLEMDVEITRSSQAGHHGMAHTVRLGDFSFGVHVELQPSGRWHAKLVIPNNGEMAGLGENPSQAFSAACDLAEPQLRSRGLALPWGDIHNALQAQRAFIEEDSIHLSSTRAHALGIPVANGRLPTVAEAERGLRESDYMRATYGLGPDSPWRVVSIGSEHDYYREVTIHVRFGIEPVV